MAIADYKPEVPVKVEAQEGGGAHKEVSSLLQKGLIFFCVFHTLKAQIKTYG